MNGNSRLHQKGEDWGEGSLYHNKCKWKPLMHVFWLLPTPAQPKDAGEWLRNLHLGFTEELQGQLGGQGHHQEGFSRPRDAWEIETGHFQHFLCWHCTNSSISNTGMKHNFNHLYIILNMEPHQYTGIWTCVLKLLLDSKNNTWLEIMSSPLGTIKWIKWPPPWGPSWREWGISAIHRSDKLVQQLSDAYIKIGFNSLINLYVFRTNHTNITIPY